MRLFIKFRHAIKNSIDKMLYKKSMASASNQFGPEIDRRWIWQSSIGLAIDTNDETVFTSARVIDFQ